VTSRSPGFPQRLYALKDRDTFIVADSHGDIVGAADGLFHDDTRILSRWELVLGDRSPTLLSGAVSQDNVYFTSHGLNRAIPAPAGRWAARASCTWSASASSGTSGSTSASASPATIPRPSACRWSSTSPPTSATCSRCAARGARARGQLFPPEPTDARCGSATRAWTGWPAQSVIAFSEAARASSADQAAFQISLGTDECRELYVEVGVGEADPPSRERFRAAAARARFAMRRRRRQGARLTTNGRLFNAWIDKSRADLALLTTPMQTGPYPYAGIPWFSTTFGRDGLLTAGRSYGSSRSWRAACCPFWPPTRRTRPRPSVTASPARSCTRPGAARWRRSARCRSAAITAGSTPRRCSWRWPAPTPSAPATTPAGRWWPALERAAGWITTQADRHPLG
jgi:hypothetical protein